MDSDTLVLISDLVIKLAMGVAIGWLLHQAMHVNDRVSKLEAMERQLALSIDNVQHNAQQADEATVDIMHSDEFVEYMAQQLRKNYILVTRPVDEAGVTND